MDLSKILSLFLFILVINFDNLYARFDDWRFFPHNNFGLLYFSRWDSQRRRLNLAFSLLPLESSWFLLSLFGLYTDTIDWVKRLFE